MKAISIRPFEQTDLPTVAELLQHLARRSITVEFSLAAQEKFQHANDAEAIASFVAEGFRYHIAEAQGELVGFVGVRDNAHLYHLFVAESVQRKGVGRQLWDTAKAVCYAAGNTGRFTVNSSNNAIAVYESFGFVRSAPMQNNEGVLYNPMILVAASD